MRQLHLEEVLDPISSIKVCPRGLGDQIFWRPLHATLYSGPALRSAPKGSGPTCSRRCPRPVRRGCRASCGFGHEEATFGGPSAEASFDGACCHPFGDPLPPSKGTKSWARPWRRHRRTHHRTGEGTTAVHYQHVRRVQKKKEGVRRRCILHVTLYRSCFGNVPSSNVFPDQSQNHFTKICGYPHS